MTLSIISAIGENNEIGKNNSLLWNLPIDMKYFKNITVGHPIIMGQKTYESIGFPLPNRTNIVLTNDKNFNGKGLIIAYGLNELNNIINSKEYETKEIFVIGGAQIYKLFINKADKLYITHVNAEFSDADTYFPVIDKDKWEKISEDKHSKDEKNIYDCNFVVFKKIL